MITKLQKNKYKLLLLVIVMLVFVDMFLHKGLVRFLIPKTFSNYTVENIKPINRNGFLNRNKNWVKAVNTAERMLSITNENAGIELDIYYDTLKNIFDVHHDPDKSIGQNFEDLLIIYKRKNLQASIWIDFKNANEKNNVKALETLKQLRDKYDLQDKILVESSYPNLLKPFSDNQFYTSYYTPYFNPYLSTEKENEQTLDSITSLLKKYPVHALSGYYFQMPFLHKYFPDFPLLIWSPNDKWSFVNWVYKKKIERENEIFISLYQ